MTSRSGTVAGMAIGVLLLALLAVWVLRGEGAGVRVLVAIWLWFLPMIGLSGLAGWLLGTGMERMGRRR